MTLTRLKEFGSWSEQTSSSGKRYYYNRDTEVSQWEKPAEWKEHEKALIEKFKLSKAQKTSFVKSQHSVRPSTSINNTLIENNLTNVSTTTLNNNKSPNASNSSKYPNVNANSNKILFTNESFAVPQGLQKNSLKRMREEDHQNNETSNLYQSVPKAHRNSVNFTSLTSSRYSTLTSMSVQTTNTVTQQNESGFSTSKLSNVSINSSSNTLFCNTSFATSENLSLLNLDLPKQHNNNLSINQQPPHLESSNQNTRMSSNVISKTNISQSQKTIPVVTNISKVTPNSLTDKTLNTTLNKNFNTENKDATNCLSNSSLKKIDEQQKIVSETNNISQILTKPALKFDERKYARFYRADLTAYRRNWSSDAYINEAKKLVERSAKQTSKLNSIDEEIRSVYSLIKAAELRCMLLGQKLTFIRQEITNLETKNPTN